MQQRRTRAVPYQRGSGSVEVELANLQSEVERIGPIVEKTAEKVDSLEGTRDNIRGMFIVIVALQGLMLMLLGWLLNHVQVVQVTSNK